MVCAELAKSTFVPFSTFYCAGLGAGSPSAYESTRDTHRPACILS